MLTQKVALLDITDVEGFVNRTINNAGLSLNRDEREDLVAEGICIMYRLASIYRPDPNHHRQESRFSGYAAQFLPRKLGDAWHRMHEEHRLITDPATGKRRWVYHDKHTSYESIVTSDTSENSHQVCEQNVRHLRDFAPIPVPPRARHDDALTPTAGLATAA